MRHQRTHILPWLVLVGLALLTMLLLSAPSALASEGCPNEQLREESNINPTTHEPYDMGLPECRAYEMVSPLAKQDHDAISLIESQRPYVAPNGNAIAWAGEGDYAGAENYQAHSAQPTNPYVAQRGAGGWLTRSADPPSTLIEEPPNGGTVFSPDLANESACGTVTLTQDGEVGPAIRCARREPGGSWSGTPEYVDLTGTQFSGYEVAGASSSGSDVVFYGEAGSPFLPAADTASSETQCPGGHCGGIYEEAGVDTSAPELRLVNVDNEGRMIGPENTNAIGGLAIASSRQSTDYQAISETGEKIFFTATSSGGVATVFARVNGAETVVLSDPVPSNCTTCNATLAAAEYQGASADGSKVFFTTKQQLVNGDTDEGNDLYMYDFANPPAHKVVQVSGGGLGDVTPGADANVVGVVSISEDGTLVYFVAEGVLTTLPNGLGQTATKAANNLYAYDTDTGETQFVATLANSDGQLWGEAELDLSGTANQRLAQTTPDGRYLAFDSFAKLISAGPEADTSGAQQVYRYDFETGKIIRISVGHEGFANNGNVADFNAVLGPADNATAAASPTVNDSTRAISESGDTIAFVSAAQLQSTDVVAGVSNESCSGKGREVDGGPGCEVYVWHDGTVNMISDGQNPSGTLYAGMSATGSDIFFQTRAQLVGQDTDSLGDIYDARVGGGFPAPTPEPSCTGEACQGIPLSAPTFSAPGTVSFTGGGNIPAPQFHPIAEARTNTIGSEARLLKRALARCRHEGRATRATCERAAKRRYGKAKGTGKK